MISGKFVICSGPRLGVADAFNTPLTYRRIVVPSYVPATWVNWFRGMGSLLTSALVIEFPRRNTIDCSIDSVPQPKP